MYEYIRKDGTNSGIVILEEFKMDPRQVENYKYGKLFDIYDKRKCDRGCPFPGEDVGALIKTIPFKHNEYCVCYWITENNNSYIGITGDAPKRMHEHIIHQVKYWDRIVSVNIYKVNNEIDAEKLKQFLILDLKPTLNGHRSGMISYKYYQEHPALKPPNFDEILKRLALVPVLDTINKE